MAVLSTLVAALAKHLPVRATRSSQERDAAWSAVEEALWPERSASSHRGFSVRAIPS